MGIDDKIGNAAEDALGKAKEKAGEVTGNEELEAEGVADQTKAGLEQAGEHVKDAANDVTDAAKDVLDR